MAIKFNALRAIAMMCGLLYVLPLAGQAATPVVVVDIKSFAFAPQKLTVARGAKVTWVNRDQEVHSVISKDGHFSSPGLDTDDRFTFTFDTAGDFNYVCGLHPYMTGVIHVHD